MALFNDPCCILKRVTCGGCCCTALHGTRRGKAHEALDTRSAEAAPCLLLCAGLSDKACDAFVHNSL
eukprot:904677-Amphidinium_carterae.1